MFDQQRYPTRYILSSTCPYSRALVTFARRIGGILDPEFVAQCEITDIELQKAIDGLKQVPLIYETCTPAYPYEEEIFLDMAITNTMPITDPWEFRQYNAWLGSENQWDSTMHGVNDDLIIDLL